MHRAVGCTANKAVLSGGGKLETRKQPIGIGEGASGDKRKRTVQPFRQRRQQRRHGGFDAYTRKDSKEVAADIPIVEDCAQAYLTGYKGRLAGTMTPLSCFSLNHFKHISCGSGGMVLTDDDRLRYLATLLVDKCYQREEKIRNPFFLAPNYQMTELQGAVALAQLDNVEHFVAARNRVGTRLNELLAGVPGVTPQKVPEGCRHSYFLYLFRLDLAVLGCTSDEFAAALNAEGVPNDAHTITGGRPVYLYDIFRKRSAFPGSEYPFNLAGRVFRKGDCPVAEAAFENWITMNPREQWTDTDVEEIGEAIAKVASHFAARAKRSAARA
jgi:dTDP-4-amino-4,6-dideoxygalactose transaminase